MSNQAPSRADSRRLHERGGGGKDGDGETWLLHSGREVLSRSRPDFARPRRSELVSIFVYPFSIPFGIWSKRWREREERVDRKKLIRIGIWIFFLFLLFFRDYRDKETPLERKREISRNFWKIYPSFLFACFLVFFFPLPLNQLKRISRLCQTCRDTRTRRVWILRRPDTTF